LLVGVLCGALGGAFWAPGLAGAQALAKHCLEGHDVGSGLDIAVAPDGTVHLSRVQRIIGNLLHTTIAPDGSSTDSVVTARMSILADDEVRSTGLALDGSTPWICYRNAPARRFEVAHRNPDGGWSVEVVDAGVAVGDGCDLAFVGGVLWVAYHADDRLRVGRRLGGAGWMTLDADTVPGADVGVHPAMAVDADGSVVIAHRNDTDGHLRITEWDGEDWATDEIPHPGVDAGWDPAVVYGPDGRIHVFHGVVPDPNGGDSGLWSESGRVGGAWSSGRPGIGTEGGSNAAAASHGMITLLTRLRQRSALFGSADGLYTARWDAESPFPPLKALQYQSSAAQRYSFRSLAATHDAFGLPVLGNEDGRGAWFGSSPKNPTCIWRPVDSDADALPDEVEVELGTSPDDPDSDDDGRTDGVEVLVDGTNPLGADGCMPAAETCDGTDEDCDGRIDEGLVEACYDGPGGTVGVGACRAGARTCVEGVWGACVGATTPAPEACDGVDADCDGRVDEALTGAATQCGVGACVADGAMVCMDGGFEDVCEPLPPAPADTACDGLDEDCDGGTDEDYVGTPLTCGVGACEADGATVCAAGAESDACTPRLPAGGDSVCDGIDSDCDGRVDEGFAPEAVRCGVGACERAGETRCLGGVVRNTCRPGAPAIVDLSCDGVDQDCDGVADEDADDIPSTCGVGACEAAGVQRCVGGAREDTCRPAAPAASDASCDGVDDDCDGATDEDYGEVPIACGRGACAATGARRCVAGAVVESCEPGQPVGVDASCDGVDDDCDGAADEGYAARPVACGQGACAADGLSRCVDGVVGDTCRVGAPAAWDSTCDGIDDDCDGVADEDVAPKATACGVGACAAAGTARCVDGAWADDCAANPPAANDDTCDGVDDDCDGATDEGFVARISRCGVGACGTVGRTRCVEGAELDDCEPGVPGGNDDTCDGVDDDCDGATDEGVSARPTTCGAGACVEVGERVCEGGRFVDRCVPRAPTGSDRDCDGVDDDCDGATDEGYVGRETTCGRGACGGRGATVCEDGRERDTCRMGEPARFDASCDGVDDDCDGAIDEDFARTPTVCGTGACAAAGELTCVNGVQRDTCDAGGGDTDDNCDGVDDDCDGRADEAWVARETSCGVGACEAAGTLQCVEGVAVDTCDPGRPSDVDASCDGFDDDCDGDADEDFEAGPTACGVGACAAEGSVACVEGTIEDSCSPAEPAADDTTCDGVDDDCDGATDEDFDQVRTVCGVGACGAVGRLSCADGAVADSCRPGFAAADDATCDGVDDDCDGAVDEDFAEAPTTCGVGACGATGVRRCAAGRVVNTCEPGPPAADDALCDGVDADCDGRADEGHVPEPIRCGRGSCSTDGVRVCLEGRLRNRCTPLEPRASDDATCDSRDDDCDGRNDEDYAPRPISCGVGACRAEGATICRGGAEIEACEPGPAAVGDASCDGRDDDCDGRPDEDYAPVVVRCGVGACAREGRSACEDGEAVEVCAPGRPGADDAGCDGVDDDCDGRIDEDYVAPAIRCGVGVCAAEGRRACEAGILVDLCEPGEPVDGDALCDGTDGDCDGATDEAYAPRATSCGVGACAGRGRTRCDAGAERDDCAPGAPAPDDVTCDGADDDCDGFADEDHTPVPMRCGVGACAADGVRVCDGGALVDACEPGAPLADDGTCDGVDDDCDGRTDEDYAPEAVDCGVGACAAIGATRCVAGEAVADCAPGNPAPVDDACDQVDDDCDGSVDEGFVGTPVPCGVGACANEGRTVCTAEGVVRSCEPGPATGVDDDCDGVDDDCDGATDEGFEPRAIRCGQGLCEAEGLEVCEDGVPVRQCTPSRPGGSDERCDGRDSDCDGRVDEGFVGNPVVCGAGACRALGAEACVDGEVVDVCEPGAAAADDATCDGRDDDCDGAADEDFRDERPAECGVGACTRSGARACRAGEVVEVCEPGEPADDDARCDGVDDDCDGRVDEDAAVLPTECGEGACRNAGVVACEAGAMTERCTPRPAPSMDDSDCDGEDSDCDGRVDEDCMAMGPNVPPSTVPTDAMPPMPTDPNAEDGPSDRPEAPNAGPGAPADGEGPPRLDAPPARPAYDPPEANREHLDQGCACEARGDGPTPGFAALLVLIALGRRRRH
jgi:hypothetical protein